MTNLKAKKEPEKLKKIITALQEKKGEEIISIDLTNVSNAVCDHFVICHGNSTTQVGSLSNSVQHQLKEALKMSPHHVEGQENSTWILMDYNDILVHIFLKESRSFYNLEDLWADGEINKIEEDR